MASAIRQQRLTPLLELLDMIQLTRKINLSGEAPADLLQSLAGKIMKLPAPEASSGIAGTKGRPSEQSGYELLAKELESLALRHKGGGAAEPMAGLVKQVAGVLHAELGITLLAHCYAYHGTSQTAALTYDPDFIRKHEFYPRGRPAPAGWLPAELEQGKERGSLITGSLSGLGIQLHTVEMGASAQSFGIKDWSGFVPAMLSGIRAVPRSLQSERAQEYVALTVRLGRELLASRVSDPRSGQWCDQYISMLLSPLRRERLDRFLSRGSFGDAVGVLSPSELFLLGEAYLVALDMLPSPARARLAAFVQSDGAGRVQDALKAPEFASPALDRLREIIPREGSPALDDFQDEVEQFGPFVWRRFGLTANSFRFCDSYEQLQNHPSSDLLFGRIFDLKIRLAEVGYSVGLPAAISGDLAELAIQNLITDPAAASVDSWSDVVEQISRLGPWSVRDWIQELLNLGRLSLRPGKQTDGPEEF
jgi:hypothetical protein